MQASGLWQPLPTPMGRVAGRTSALLLTPVRGYGEGAELVISRTIVSFLGGAIAAFTLLTIGYLIVEGLRLMGPWPPVAAFISVFLALWFVDFATDFLERRRG